MVNKSWRGGVPAKLNKAPLPHVPNANAADPRVIEAMTSNVLGVSLLKPYEPEKAQFTLPAKYMFGEE
jgi:hypothetical protein